MTEDELLDSLPHHLRNKVLGHLYEPTAAEDKKHLQLVAKRTAATCGIMFGFAMLVVMFVVIVTVILISVTP